MGLLVLKVVLYLVFFSSFKKTYLFLLFFFGCCGSSLLCMGFLWLQEAGATPHCGVQAARGSDFCC